MKNNILKLLVVVGLTAAARVIITRYRKNVANSSSDNDSKSDSHPRHLPHGRHTIVKKRVHELLNN